MPSAYVLAKDNLEQARAILANEVWHDSEVEYLLELAITRLAALERHIVDVVPHPQHGRLPARTMRQRNMPWLDP